MILTKHCPQCGARASEVDTYCPVDRAPLAADASPAESTGVSYCVCGHAQSGGDGICEVCGAELGLPLVDDHQVIITSESLAVITDRGIRHKVNEDAASVFVTTGDVPATILVVCDGISSCNAADQAAQLAAETARDCLRDALVADQDLTVALDQAIRRAHTAICEHAFATNDPSKDPPGTTIVAAISRGTRIVVGWVGDSRAYWLSENNAQQLTRDHSWAEELIASGKCTPEQAYQGPNGHALTRCLGPAQVMDGEAAPEPSVKVFEPSDAGGLLLCSDGLWNYAPDVGDIQALLADLPTKAGKRTERLVTYALEMGGRDNITVAMLQLPTAGDPPQRKAPELESAATPENPDGRYTLDQA